MIVLEYIFYLCIVYMVFNFIWWFVVQLPKTLLFGLRQNFAVDHSIKAIRYLFISTITSVSYTHLTLPTTAYV